jgi:hypothetical protein
LFVAFDGEACCKDGRWFMSNSFGGLAVSLGYVEKGRDDSTTSLAKRKVTITTAHYLIGASV